MPQTEALGLANLWAQADIVIRITALLLVTMSVASWYLILAKGWRLLRTRSYFDAVEGFWAAPTLPDALAVLRRRATDTPFDELARHAAAAAEHCARRGNKDTLGGALNSDEFLTRAMRRAISTATARLESGLTVLASIGSVAPFVGLFGTVWGIYHALVGIGASGVATLDRVAGPVGEALIMTAFGLFVAIPAVLAFNAFTRANRIELTELDAFAHDLHAYFTTGARLDPAQGGQSQGSPRPRLAAAHGAA